MIAEIKSKLRANVYSQVEPFWALLNPMLSPRVFADSHLSISLLVVLLSVLALISLYGTRAKKSIQALIPSLTTT